MNFYGIDNDNDVVRIYDSPQSVKRHGLELIGTRAALSIMAGVVRKWVHDVQPKTYRGMTCGANVIYWYCRAILATKHIDLQIHD